MKHFFRILTNFVGITFLLATMSAVYAAVSSLSPGDILISDQSGAVINVDPITGAQTVVSIGGFLADPYDIALSPSGDIYVADGTALGGAVIRIDPATGGQSVISSGGNFSFPMGIAFELSGDILVTNAASLGAVIRVDPSTGAQTVVSYGGMLVDSAGITVASDGSIIVANPNNSPGSGTGAIISVDPDTGAQVAISTGGNYYDPWKVTMDQSGQILVSDHNSPAGGYFCGGWRGAIISVDPLSGSQTVVSAGYPFTQPNDVDVEEDGNILVVDPYAYTTICTGTGIPTLFRINPESGVRSVLSSGGNLSLPRGIAVVPTTINAPPVLDTIGSQSGFEGVLLEFVVTTSDPDTSDSLTIDASNLPLGAIFTQNDGTTGTFSWTPNYTQEGNYENVEFCVTDDGDPVEVDCELITITIGNVNRAPVIDSISPINVSEYDVVDFFITAQDPDGDNFDLSNGGLPVGSTFDTVNGTFTWVPGYNQSGIYVVTFYATDNGIPSQIGQVDVTITVNDIPPTALNDEIIDTFTNDMVLPQEVVNSYIANLKKVNVFIEKGKITPAINQLDAFVHKVNVDMEAGIIDSVDGQMLIDMVNDIISKLTP